MLRETHFYIVSIILFLLSVPVLAQDELDTEIDPKAYLTIPAEVDDKGQAAIAGMNRFSIDLYRQTVEPGKNHFLSPASASFAMSLVYRAARGATAEEMQRTLHYGAVPADYLLATASVLDSVNFKKAGRELTSANSVWVDKSLTLRPDYLADVARLAGSTVQQVDYKSMPDEARISVNQWVADKTRDKIKNLLSPNHVTRDTRSILVNTIYWKASWTNAFPKDNTRPEPFRQLDGEPVSLPLMNQLRSFQVIEQDGVKAILLPFLGGELDMAVFLPNAVTGLPRFEAKLSDQYLESWLAKLSAAPWRETRLTLPKMHLSWGDDLVPIFKKLGLISLFGDQSDLSGMASSREEGPLAISTVIHQTYLDVDENGAEAAAATAAVAIVITGGRGNAPPPFIFRADKPFFFVLRDRRTGLICFMGRFVTAEP